MKKILVFFIVALIIPASSLWALNVSVQFADSTLQGSLLPGKIQTELQSILNKYDAMPEFARGMANASVYASNAGTSRGYQGYDLFNVSVGNMMSLQMPGSGLNFDAFKKDLENKGDVYAGTGEQPVAGQLGINMGFLLEDLYLTFKFGKFSTDWLNREIKIGDDEISYNSSIFGFLLNYSLLRERSLLAGSILWRGVTLGSGFTFSSSNIGYGLDLDRIEVTSSDGITADVDPSIELSIDSKNYVIPVEIYTSMRFLYIMNFGVGVGFDFVVGSDTDLLVSADGDAVVTSDSVGGSLVDKKGRITITDAGSKDKKADSFRARFMANLGVSLGPVYLDMPVALYADNGYSVGITAGIVW